MTDINYKEEMKLTDDEIDAIKPTQEECAKITAAMELYKPPEFKGCFANDEYDKLTKRKIAEAQFKKLQPIIAAQRAEIEELKNKNKHIHEAFCHMTIRCNEAESQLSTARAETAKELYEEFICPMCYRLNPQHAEMDNGVGCKTCADKEAYLAPDKEGGK